MKYKNYVFDLYGTLVDIHTDEENPAVWDRLAYFYNYYGADYIGEELRIAYDAIINELEGVLQGDKHEMYPEIQIENVFRKLFLRKNIKRRSFILRRSLIIHFFTNIAFFHFCRTYFAAV